MSKGRTRNTIRGLLLNASLPVRMVNLITLYRIVTFPLLIALLFFDAMSWFKWLLLASFFTDAIDGTLARWFDATSILGAKLDSIGDDLTVLAGAIGLLVYQFDFVEEQLLLFVALFGLFLIQLAVALIRYRRVSSFHTYLAKIAAVVTGCFLLSVFFFDGIIYPFFYTAWIVTAIELIEQFLCFFYPDGR